MGSASSKMRLVRTGKGHRKEQQVTPRSNSFPVVKKANSKGCDETKQQQVHRVMTDGSLKIDPVPKATKPSNGNVINGESDTNGFTLNIESLPAPTTNGDVVDHASPPPSARKLLELKISKYSDKITPSELYNLLIAETWQGLPQIHDPGYLLLLDCRDKASFEKLHILTARHHSALYSEYGLLLPSQLKLFHIIVLYGHSNSTNTLCDYSRKLAEDEIEHYLLECGSSEFFTKYPFLGTQDHYVSNELRSTLQTMPSEVIPGRLYQGNAKHAHDPYIISSLGVTHIVNVTLEHPNKFEDSVKYLRIQLDDRPQVDLHSWLPKTSEFIKNAIEPRKDSSDVNNNPGVVLVHCNLGRSRSSTVVLGYLMQVCRMSLEEACNLLKDCRPSARPNIGFLDQLLRYEKEIFGINKTDLHELPF